MFQIFVQFQWIYLMQKSALLGSPLMMRVTLQLTFVNLATKEQAKWHVFKMVTGAAPQYVQVSVPCVMCSALLPQGVWMCDATLKNNCKGMLSEIDLNKENDNCSDNLWQHRTYWEWPGGWTKKILYLWNHTDLQVWPRIWNGGWKKLVVHKWRDWKSQATEMLSAW